MPMPLDTIRNRYPRLLRAMRRVACLTESEAANAIYMRQLGDNWAGEAVNHFGGIAEVLQTAITKRHLMRRVYP